MTAAIFMITGFVAAQSAAARPCDFYPFVTKWGAAGTGPGAFAGPSGVAVGTGSAVFVADDGNNRIQTFSPGGTSIREWPTLTGPTGIAADAAGNLFVSNTAVEKFDATGARLPGFSVGSFAGAGGVAVDSQGNVFASDLSDFVWKFDDEGNLVTTWGGNGSTPGLFNRARGVAIDSNDHVFVVDQGNDRVQEFDNDGTFVRAWTTVVSGGFPVGFCPAGIAIDDDDNVYVTITCSIGLEFVDARVEKFDRLGAFLASFGVFGTGNGALRYPGAVAVNAAGDVFVADTGNDRVQKFGCGVATCGDGAVQPTELCDDGNTVNSDGCSAVCTVEEGWSCSGTPSACETICGDGILRDTEQCDDGNGIDEDYCLSNCTYNECGDGTLCADSDTCGLHGTSVREECDDGNLTAGDGCDATCKSESARVVKAACGPWYLDHTGKRAAGRLHGGVAEIQYRVLNGEVQIEKLKYAVLDFNWKQKLRDVLANIWLSCTGPGAPFTCLPGSPSFFSEIKISKEDKRSALMVSLDKICSPVAPCDAPHWIVRKVRGNNDVLRRLPGSNWEDTCAWGLEAFEFPAEPLRWPSNEAHFVDINFIADIRLNSKDQRDIAHCAVAFLWNPTSATMTTVSDGGGDSLDFENPIVFTAPSCSPSDACCFS